MQRTGNHVADLQSSCDVMEYCSQIPLMIQNTNVANNHRQLTRKRRLRQGLYEDVELV